MTNKEKLEQLTSNIGELVKLTQDIHETDIYPVSFFSEAFDLTNKIQDILHEMEVDQIALFDKQIREHQAQISSVVRPRKTAVAIASESISEPMLGEEMQYEPEEEKTHPSKPIKIENEVALQTTVSHDKQLSASSSSFYKKNAEASLNDVVEKNKSVDLRRAFTLNDRFRFCRELFGRDEKKMNRIISELNEKKTYQESLSYLKADLGWNFENETVTDFLKLVERRFS